MKENILSIIIGAAISFFMSFTGEEILKVLFFSLLGGFMGFIGNTICRYLLHKVERITKAIFLKKKRRKNNAKQTENSKH